MAIEVEAPDGSIVEFPDGTSDAVINQAMAQRFGGGQPAKPEMTTGEIVEDVAKSAGIGLAQGAIGIGTLPGNIEQLGRAGINMAGRALGFGDNVVSPETALPNYQGTKEAIEGVTGKFYEPQSVYGEYARTGGEMVPAAFGGGGALARAARVALPAVASETAGQATKGTAYEPWARVGGAIAGGSLPKAVSPAAGRGTPGTAQDVRALERAGVTSLTAGQRTGSKLLRQMEDATETIPGGGGRAATMQGEAYDQFGRAALREAGIDANRATPDVLQRAFDNMGREYQALAPQMRISASPQLTSSLRGIANQYAHRGTAGTRIDYVSSIADDIAQRGRITGDEAASFISDMKAQARQYAKNPDTQDAAQALGNMVRRLEDHVVNNAPQGQRQALRGAMRDLNNRYRNALILEDAVGRGGELAAEGIITPAQLRAAVKKSNSRDWTRGRTNLSELARSGQRVMTPLKSSGTAERLAAQGALAMRPAVTMPGAGAAGTAAGFALGGPVGAAVGGLAGTALGAAMPAANARMLMSSPIQAYLGNQAVPFAVQEALRGPRTVAGAMTRPRWQYPGLLSRDYEEQTP